eukprot:gene25425-31885_t
MYIPIKNAWQLNERHYGGLQGMNKQETVDKYGKEQVLVWRRSYDIPPPPCDIASPSYPANDPKYAGIPEAAVIQTESLKTTLERVLPYWHSEIAPNIKSGKRVLIAAHGNSLRALVKYLDNIPESDISELNIPTGVPLVYELDANLRPIPHPDAIAPLQGRYIGNQDEIRARILGVKNHEYGYNVDAQIEYMQLNANWHMPSRYYHERIQIKGDAYMTLIVLDTSPCVSDYRGSDQTYYDPCSSEYPTCSLVDTDDDFQGQCHFHSNIVGQDCNLQYMWLENVLEKWVPADDWLVVVGHHPLDELDVRDFVSLLQKYKMAIYLNGHVHTLNQYTIDDRGAYVTTGAGSMVDTVDQRHPVTAAKRRGQNFTVSATHGGRGENGDGSDGMSTKVGNSTVGASHTYQTVYNNEVAGFTLHTLSADLTTLLTQYITYTGEVVHSFTSNKKGKIVS